MSPVAIRVVAVLVAAVLAGLAASALFGGDERRVVPGAAERGGDGPVDPLAWTEDRNDELAAAAARGHAHVLYAKSPGGARASAERVARYRDLIEQAAKEAGVEADLVEGMVLLESAGRPSAVADPQLEGAVGLTQILAETGRNLLKMRVDPAGARRLTRSIRRNEARGRDAVVRRLRDRRRRVDERFDPAKSLAATGRYLKFASGELGGRADLAVASYHMGVGNLQRVLDDYGDDDDIGYVQLYFDSTPLTHEDAYRRLMRLGDDSSTYLWRVMAAKEIMRLYRSDPKKLEREAALQTAKSSAEEVLHPQDATQAFATPSELRNAYDAGDVVALPVKPLRDVGITLSPSMGELSGRLKRSPKTYRGLRPEALALLVYMGRGVKAISGDEPLTLTSTVRDESYQRQLVRGNREATRNYSLHTTGYAFDISRGYRSGKQALAFQFLLDRLQSLDLIAWVREPEAIHVTVSSKARMLQKALREG